MTQQSLKNLDSFSRGYIEDVRSKVDFNTTLRATMSTVAVDNSLTFAITSAPTSVVDQTTPLENDNPIIGKIISGAGITGSPRVISIASPAAGVAGLIVTIDQPQTIAASTVITFSDVNSGIDRYELTGSTISRSKEDIRIENLVPEELLEYSDTTSGGIRSFMESYYKFMNLEEFTYKDEKSFDDVVINNVATFRISDGKNNKFFQKNLILSASFFDSDGYPLLVGGVDGSPSLVGDQLELDDTSRLTVNSSYQVVSLGDGTATNIATGINNISAVDQDSWGIGDIFVAVDVGTAYNATLGTEKVKVQLLQYPTITDDILTSNIVVSNSNNLPGRLGKISEPTGRTVTISGLSPRLNNRKITMKTFIYNYVDAGPSYRLNTLEDALNINEADEEFLDMMQKEIAPALDKSSPVNKRAVYQKIIDFYKLRGSTDSIETFFKLLFNEQEVQVSYPWDNTLKPSSGTFDQQSAITTNYAITDLIESSDNANNDLFGRSVSVSGESFVAGAPLEDAAGTDGGAVYVFTTADKGVSYSQEAKIISTAGDASKAADRFGRCVELDGDTLAISAPNDETTTHNTAFTGSVEIWTRSKDINGANVWAFNNKLIPPSAGESFAAGNESISLSGDYLAVGHKGFDADSATIAEGAVIVYKRTGATWSVLQTIRPAAELYSTSLLNKEFGETVVLKGKYLVVSFQDYSTSAIPKTGRVVVYIKNEISGLYEQDTILAPANDISNQNFGYAIDITNVENGTPRIALTSKDNPYHTVYIFERKEESDSIAKWSVISSIPNAVNATATAQSAYGAIVRLSGNNLIIGDHGFDAGAAINTGRVIHYEYNENINLWNQKAELKGDDSVAYTNFGYSIDLSDDDNNYLIIGSPGAPEGNGTEKGYVRTYNRPALVGKYSTSSGFLSEKSIKVHDSDFYQKFSYVVKVGRNLSQWEDQFNKLVHPAGFKYFGEVLLVLQAVRNVLGDNNKDTTVGLGEGKEEYSNSYSASPAFRKTLSSMPGVQPGFIGIEDVGLLISAIASTFGIIGLAKANKDAKLSVKTIKSDAGGLAAISIPAIGHGYPEAPDITLGGTGSGATATAVINSRGELTKINIAGPHTTFNFSGLGIDDNRSAGTKTGKSTATSTGSGSSGVVTIVVAADKSITSITSTTHGSNYAVGDVITIAGSELGTGAADIKFTVESVGTGYSVAGTTASAEKISETAESLPRAIASGIGKLNSTSTGLFLIGLNNKSYTTTPTIVISPPDALLSSGKPVPSNIQATATLTRNTTTGVITGFTITNPGLGYLNDATITINTNSTNEKRAPEYIHKKIIPINHDVNINAVLPENDYYSRKDYAIKENPAFLGPKKFQGNYKLKDFTNITIQDISTQINDGTLINKLNIQTSLSKQT